MKLKMLIEEMDIKNISCDSDIEISGIAYDSRKVKQGDVFVAMKGEKADGHYFIGDAVKKGAVAIVYEEAIARGFSLQNSKLPASNGELIFIRVDDSRKALAYISNNFYERPSEKLTVIGVTGTNGKTTTTYLIKSMLEAYDKDAGLIGTISYIVKDKQYNALHTTPEALEFQSILAEMVLSGCGYAVTEVSSHALALRRVDYTDFKVAIFTNLTRDHLDFHVTMEDYFKAKEKLFKEFLSKDGTAVINFDDLYGRRLISELSASRILTYGIEKGADIAAVNISDSFKGLAFDIRFEGRIYSIKSPLIGIHNVYNILSAAGAAAALNVPWDRTIEGIEKMGSVKGRFEKVDMGQDFLCIVDYAHTEDALERLISTARELMKNGQGKIITVFGCGGDRDKGKRPRMGAIATKLSDYVVITSDNPRSEDPAGIIKDIETGALRRNYSIEPDRKDAITKAVKAAETGDILLIAGKGHEDYQELKGKRQRFSDREVAEESIKKRMAC